MRVSYGKTPISMFVALRVCVRVWVRIRVRK